jgi:nitric-oxide synthase
MILTIGGIDYPCAPFNGYYMSTEIANRDLADERRYDLLPEIADCMEIERDPDKDLLWKDRALTELNLSVLHSFRRDGVTVVDHHTASKQFMMFSSREESAGRAPSADWSWIVPPQGSSACPVYHLRMNDRHLVPNYYESRATDGALLGPNYDDHLRSSARQRWDKARRRWYLWWSRRS